MKDGTLINVTLIGDENNHWLETSDGRMLIKDQYGQYIFASFLYSDTRLSFKQTQERFRTTRPQAREMPFAGDKKTSVLLINFSDTTFQAGYTHGLFNDMFNKEVFSEHNLTSAL